MSQTVYPVKLSYAGRDWSFNPEEAKGLAFNSGYVNDLQEEYEQSGQHPSEEIHIEINQQNFELCHVDDALQFLKDSNWQPEAPRKVTSNKLDNIGLSDPAKALLTKYDHETIFKVFSVAEYFRIGTLKNVCRVRVAMEVWMDPTDPAALNRIREKVGLKQEYDQIIEDHLTKEYPFLEKKN
jgi:hypothetical protein